MKKKEKQHFLKAELRTGIQPTVKKTTQHLTSILLIIIISIALYTNALQNGFAYDDAVTIVNNAFIKDLTNLPKLFKRDYFVISAEMTYRPVVTFTYFIEYTLFGLNPLGFHLTNILLHATNGVLLYIFLTFLIPPTNIHRSGQSRLFTNPPFLISTFFVAHPVLTEAVNAISFREDLLAFLFYITALILYLKSKSLLTLNPHSSIFIYLLSLAAYLLALLSKEMAITLPLIIYCYEWIYADNKKESKTSTLFNRYNIGYIVLSFVYVYIRFYHFSNPTLKRELPSWGLIERLLTIPWVILSYIKLCLFPVSLSADYETGAMAHYASGAIKSLFDPSFIGPFLIIALLLAIALIWNKKRLITFGVLFFLITLIPVYNIIPLGNPFAERYLYLPTVGFAIVAGLAFYSIIRTRISKFENLNILLITLFFSILCVYSIIIIRRNKTWEDNYSLWSEIARKAPNNARAYMSLGFIYIDKKLFDKVIENSKIALKLKPDYPEALTNLGIAYVAIGRPKDAVAEFKAALKIRPTDPNYYYNLGVAYEYTGQLEEAIQEYKTALKFDPTFTDATNSLREAYSKKAR